MPREYQFPFELRHLVYFREVARQLHFRKAAESLNIAQPALSRQVAQLEKSLKVALFHRSRRRVELTAAGRLLNERIEPLLRSLNGVSRELAAVSQGEVGLVRVAFTGLAMATVLPGILREFSRRHPGIRLELNEAPTSAQMAALESGDLGCGFYHPGATPSGLRTRMLLKERNGILLPPHHPLAARSELKLRDLAETPFILFPRAHNPGYYDRILAACTHAGITPRIAEEIWPRANGIGLVRAGLGVTFLTPSEAKNLPTDVQFRPLIDHAPESRLVVGWRAAPAPDPAVAAFLAIATGGVGVS